MGRIPDFALYATIAAPCFGITVFGCIFFALRPCGYIPTISPFSSMLIVVLTDATSAFFLSTGYAPNNFTSQPKPGILNSSFFAINLTGLFMLAPITIGSHIDE
jgi:hypothetical protein